MTDDALNSFGQAITAFGTAACLVPDLLAAGFRVAATLPLAL